MTLLIYWVLCYMANFHFMWWVLGVPVWLMHLGFWGDRGRK
jgi:hypothetical protein